MDPNIDDREASVSSEEEVETEDYTTGANGHHYMKCPVCKQQDMRRGNTMCSKCLTAKDKKDARLARREKKEVERKAREAANQVARDQVAIDTHLTDLERNLKFGDSSLAVGDLGALAESNRKRLGAVSLAARGPSWSDFTPTKQTSAPNSASSSSGKKKKKSKDVDAALAALKQQHDYDIEILKESFALQEEESKNLKAHIQAQTDHIQALTLQLQSTSVAHTLVEVSKMTPADRKGLISVADGRGRATNTK